MKCLVDNEDVNEPFTCFTLFKKFKYTTELQTIAYNLNNRVIAM